METSFQKILGHSAGRRSLRTGLIVSSILVVLMFFILPVAATPTAKFTVSPTKGDAPLTVKISSWKSSSDCDVDDCTYEWDFGDGNDSYTTTKTTFSHKYKTADTYTITLTMTNGDSETDTYTKDITVNEQELACAFSASVTSGAAPLTVKFTDESDGDVTDYAWDFDDGGDSTSQNPSYTFEDAGTYSVELTISNDDTDDEDSCTKTIKVLDVEKPAASFVASTTSGTAPLTVTFTDRTDNDPTSWSWSFGDGSTAATQNPSHTYTNAGTYSVTLKATNAAGSSTVTESALVSVNAAKTPTPTTIRTAVPTSRPTTVATTAAPPAPTDSGISLPIVAGIIIVAVIIAGIFIMRRGRGGMGRWDL